jgi:hypothetical protein
MYDRAKVASSKTRRCAGAYASSVFRWTGRRGLQALGKRRSSIMTFKRFIKAMARGSDHNGS